MGLLASGTTSLEIQVGHRQPLSYRIVGFFRARVGEDIEASASQRAKVRGRADDEGATAANATVVHILGGPNHDAAGVADQNC
ncbi:MAG: hypothetical protein BGO83_02655 [Devosia sp. 66-14]|nr:MAG: hypothetical protein ABS47_21000 [Devosia sp. SCN 66-27]OJX23775.1 MAG: hypothetical protein BGO83_02655 [Devosia sp. 66-14]